MEPDDNPFRRPTGQASINATPNPLPAVAADAVDGTGQRQCGCARLAEANATAQQSITVGADVLGSLQTQRAQLISTQGTLAQQQSDLNRAGLCRNQGLYGRPARPNRLIGWPGPEAASGAERSLGSASWPRAEPACCRPSSSRSARWQPRGAPACTARSRLRRPHAAPPPPLGRRRSPPRSSHTGQ